MNDIAFFIYYSAGSLAHGEVILYSETLKRSCRIHGNGLPLKETRTLSFSSQQKLFTGTITLAIRPLTVSYYCVIGSRLFRYSSTIEPC